MALKIDAKTVEKTNGCMIKKETRAFGLPSDPDYCKIYVLYRRGREIRNFSAERDSSNDNDLGDVKKLKEFLAWIRTRHVSFANFKKAGELEKLRSFLGCDEGGWITTHDFTRQGGHIEGIRK